MKPVYVFASFGAGLQPRERATYIGAAFLLVGALAGLVYKPVNESGGIGTFYFYAFATLMWWSVAVNRALMLMQDAHRLRTPGAAASALAGLGVHFLAIALLPSLIVAIAGNVGFFAMLGYAVCLTLLAWVAPFLPTSFSYLNSLLYMTPIACWLLAQKGYLPGVRDHGFMLYAWSAAAAMAIFVFHRGRRLFTDADDDALLLSRVRKRHLLGNAGWDAGFADFSAPAATRNIRIDRADSCHPVAALQIWLGDPFAPTSAIAQVRRCLLPVLISVAVGVLFIALKLIGTAAIVLVLFGQNTFMALRGIFIPRLRSVFAAKGGDLEWIAAQPGMGSGNAAKRHLLAAVFKPFLVACSVQFVFVLILAQAMSAMIAPQLTHGSRFSLADIVVALICGDLMVAVLMINTLIGRVFSMWIEFIGLLLLMLVALTVTGFPYGSATINLLEIALMLAFTVPLAWLGISAWREFQRRPHPFLLNS